MFYKKNKTAQIKHGKTIFFWSSLQKQLSGSNEKPADASDVVARLGPDKNSVETYPLVNSDKVGKVTERIVKKLKNVSLR